MQLQLAIGHFQQGRNAAAKAIGRQLLKRDPSCRDALRLLLAIAAKEQNAAQTIDLLRHAKTIDPHDPTSRIQLGSALVDSGQVEDARAEYEEALRLWPEASEIYARLTAITHYHKYNADVSKIEHLYAVSVENSVQRRNYAFALGKIFDELDDCAKAFGYFREGNSIARTTSAYRIENDIRLCEEIAAVFDGDFFAHNPTAASNSPLPIFVIGMPRTGTTLLEQILAGHPDVYGAGEIATLNELVAGLSRRPGEQFPLAFRQISRRQLATMARTYLAKLESISDGRKYVVNKNVNLFLYVGVIYALFSGAVIIRCRRNSLDAGLSLFMRDMPNQPYGYGLDMIGRFTSIYEKLMDHWGLVQPGRLIDVDYAEFVSDPQPAVRRLLSQCGLAYSPDCLRFHESSGLHIHTASHLQVRQPVHSNSIGRWKRYEQFLGPLQTALRSK